MTTETDLHTRSGGACELCAATDDLAVFKVTHAPASDSDGCVLVCRTCQDQMEHPERIDANHWRGLSTSMWTPVPAVQVMAWRVLNRLKTEAWAAELLDMLYLEDETLAWAKAGADGNHTPDDLSVAHLDCNGAVLSAGDTVVLIKDLNVKGAGFTAKRGTAVRSISLVPDNAQQIEGRVNSQQIVILTKFVKKSA